MTFKLKSFAYPFAPSNLKDPYTFCSVKKWMFNASHERSIQFHSGIDGAERSNDLSNYLRNSNIRVILGVAYICTNRSI